MKTETKSVLALWHSLKVRATVFTISIFVLGFWALSLFVSRSLQADMERVLGEQQFSVVTSVSKDIDDDLTNRFQALETIAKDMNAALLARPAALQARLEERPLLQLLFNGGVFVTGPDGTAIADVPLSAGRIGTNYMDRESVSIPLKEGKAVIGQPVMGKILGAPVFSMVAPIRDARDQVIGALVATVNLDMPNFLDKITRSAYGKSGGYVLISKHSRLVITATDKSRIMEPLPAVGVNPWVDRFADGYEGFAVSPNPKGVEVLVSGKGIPSAGWYVLASLPTQEAFAPIASMQQRLLWASLLLTLLTGTLTWRVLARQLAPLVVTADAMTALAHSDEMPQPLPFQTPGEIGQLVTGFNRILEKSIERESTVAANKAFKDAVLDSLNAEIAVVDRNGVIQSVNARWQRFALENNPEPGTQTPQCCVGASYLAACEDGPDTDSEDNAAVRAGLGGVLDGHLPRFTHEYRCGSPSEQRWFSMVIMPLGREGAVVAHTDITERKLAEAALQRSINLLERTESMANLASFEWDVDTNTVTWSPEMFCIFGRDPALGAPNLQGQAQLYTPESTQFLFDAVEKALADGTPYELELMSVQPDGEQRACWVKGFPDRDASGRVVRVAGLVQDITARKQAEAVDRFLAQTSIGPASEPFFDALARFLAQTLQMDYICIDRLEGDALNATTLSVWHDGHFEDNLTYALRDTPCGDVVGRGVCCFPASVRQFFPNDAALQDLRAESYIGVTLWSHTGQPIGLIAVIGRRTLANRTQAEVTLARVAGRAAAELERLNVETALRESEMRFRKVVELMPDAVAIHCDGKLLHINPAGVAMFGAKTEQDLIGKPILQLVHPDFHPIVLARINRAAEHGEAAGTNEERYVRLDGSGFVAEVQGQPIVLAGQASVLVTLRDITERKAAQEKLQLAAGVFTHALEGIMITTPEATIIDVNDAFTRITGYTRDDVLGKNPRLLSSGHHDADHYAGMWRSLVQEGYWCGEVWNRRKNGEVVTELQAISAVRDAQGKVSQYIALFSDITERKAHENKLEHIAHFDALTNLPNRVLLADRLQQAMAQAQRRQQHVAVVYLDLDGFKAINDRHDHQTGDQVLITLAQRMKDALREGDTMARIGGDEFVAVLIDLQDTSACVPMLGRLLAAAAEPVQVSDLTLQVSASLGVTFYPQAQDIDADQLLRQADQAMYQAKVAGKNRYHVFDAAQDSSLRSHHESLERIRQALQDREFVLHYQPKVNMHTGQVVGAEALIRWQHPDKGLLAPATFLPVIEDHPLAVDVDEWVMDAALTQIEDWHTAGLDLPVSVNIGARQLQQVNFVERLQAILARHPQVNPCSLELEVLETSAMADIGQVSQVIEDCARMGVRFALDDFGTGYSSLTYLKRLRVALLKIDQSFVRDMLDDPDDLAILQGVIGLADAFNREVIAEGVETIAHGTALLQLGCQLAQGYGVARPMPAGQMVAWVASWRPDAAWCASP